MLALEIVEIEIYRFRWRVGVHNLGVDTPPFDSILQNLTRWVVGSHQYIQIIHFANQRFDLFGLLS